MANFKKLANFLSRCTNRDVAPLNFWSYNARSDWFSSSFASGCVNTVMTYHCILLASFYLRKRKRPLLVHTRESALMNSKCQQLTFE